MDAGVGLGLSGLPTGNISSGDIRDAVADIVSRPSYRGSAAVLSGVLRWEKTREIAFARVLFGPPLDVLH